MVIDVLRATTSMISALDNGAREIWAAASIPQARLLRRKLGAQVLLCGERNGLRIPGFQLGNSPLEFTRSAVKGKRLVMATTNGTKAVRWAQPAREMLIGSLTNASAVARRLAKTPRDIVIVCAGKEGGFSLEDAVCAGLIVAVLRKHRPAFSCNDPAVACAALFQQWKSKIPALLAGAEHGLYLAGLGLKKDVEVCAKVDTTTSVPAWRRGRITVLRG